MLGTSLPSVFTAFRTRMAYTLGVWLAIPLRASAVGHIPADIYRQTDIYRHIYTDIYIYRHIPAVSGAERTSGSLLQDGLFRCGPRRVTDTVVPHRLVHTDLAIPFRSENLVIGVQQDGTNNFRHVPSVSRLSAFSFQARFPVTFGWERVRPFIPRCRADLILSLPRQRLTHSGLRASISCRGVRCFHPSPFDGRVIIFSVDDLPMIRLEQSRSRFSQSPADPRTRSSQG